MWKMKKRGCRGILREMMKGVLGEGKRVMKVRCGGDDASSSRCGGGLKRTEDGGHGEWDKGSIT